MISYTENNIISTSRYIIYLLFLSIINILFINNQY